MTTFDLEALPDAVVWAASAGRTLGLRLCCGPVPNVPAERSAATRALAVGLLAEAGLPDASVGRDAARRPVWPSGWVGSLSHSRERGAAVIAPASAFAGVGIDIESPARMHERLWGPIATPDERRALAERAPAEANRIASGVFSAKEAGYKILEPHFGAAPGFHDCAVNFMAGGAFRIVAERGAWPELAGQFLRHDAHLVAVAWLLRP